MNGQHELHVLRHSRERVTITTSPVVASFIDYRETHSPCSPQLSATHSTPELDLMYDLFQKHVGNILQQKCLLLDLVRFKSVPPSSYRQSSRSLSQTYPTVLKRYKQSNIQNYVVTHILLLLWFLLMLLLRVVCVVTVNRRIFRDDSCFVLHLQIRPRRLAICFSVGVSP
jgi:hypothetical protein